MTLDASPGATHDAPAPHLAPMTRAERNIFFIENFMRVPEGEHIGEPMLLDYFQKEFIRDVFDNPHGTDMGILSMARKNGKTSLVAAIVLCFLIGPEARRNAQIASGAMARKQAAVLFDLAVKILEISPGLRERCKVIPSSNTIIGIKHNVKYVALSAEAGTAFGLSLYVVVLDEVGQVRGERSAFVDALVTAQGAYDDAIKFIISTQAASDSDFLSITIDDAIRSNDPRIVCHVYEADADCDVLDEEQWLKANPGLYSFRSEKDLATQAKRAARMPSFEATFRNLNLNQRVNKLNPFVAPKVWRSNGGTPSLDVFKKFPVYGGLDLSKTTDLCALVLCCEDDEKNIHTQAHFWKPEATIFEHQDRDRAPYVRWRDQGYIRTTPGQVIEYSFVAKAMAEIISGMNIELIGFDAWKFADLKTHFEPNQINESMFEKVIQGPRTFSPMLEALEAELLAGRVLHGGNPVLTMCAANAVVVQDSNENRKLDKARSTGRIDGMVALAMASGLLKRKAKAEKGKEAKKGFGAVRL